MTPTIRNLLEALVLPAQSFSELAGLQPVLRDDGTPALCRRTRFVEAEIMLDGMHYLLCCPLSPTAIPSVERMANRLKYTLSERLTPYRILCREMRYTDFAGKERLSDVVLHLLPDGRKLDEVFRDGCSDERIARELTCMEEEFLRLGFTHGNLRPENIVLTPAGKLVAVRYHHARFDECDDSEAFEALRRLVRENGPSQELHDLPSPLYQASQTSPSRRKRVSAMFEQLIRVEDEGGYGFVDTSDRTVIEPQFVWANDFHEGRAEVQTSGGMGLIDKRGRYVIEPRYKNVEYREEKGVVLVSRSKDEWALFDYEGQMLYGFDTLAEVEVRCRV